MTSRWTVPWLAIFIAVIGLDVCTARWAKTEIVWAHCTLTWKKQRRMEEGDCRFRQAFGNVQIWMGERWVFDFPAKELGKTYQRTNNAKEISFTRDGAYTLIIQQDGRPQNN